MYTNQVLTATNGQIITCYACSSHENYLVLGLNNSSIDLYEKDGNDWKKLNNVSITQNVERNKISKLIFSKNEDFLIILTETSILRLLLRVATANSTFNLYTRPSEHLLNIFTGTDIKDILIIRQNELVIIKEINWFSLKVSDNKDIVTGETVVYNEPIKNHVAIEKFFIISTEKNTYLYSADSKKLLLTLESDFSEFSPCEKYMISQKDNIFKVYAPNSAEQSAKIIATILKTTDEAYSEISFLNNNERENFIFIKEKNKSRKIINWTDHHCKLLNNIIFHEYTFSPQYNQCLLHESNVIKVMGIKENKWHRDDELEKFLASQIHLATDYFINYTPISNSIVLMPKNNIQLKIFSFKKKKEVLNSPSNYEPKTPGRLVYHANTKTVANVTMSSNKDFIATAFERLIEIRRISDNVIIKLHDIENASCCKFSHDGQLFAFGFSNKVKVIKINFIDNADFQEITLNSPPEFLEFSNNNLALLVFEKDGTLSTLHFYTQAIYNSIKIQEKKDAFLYLNNTVLTYTQNKISFTHLLNRKETTHELIIDDTLPQQALGLLPPPSLNDSEISTTDSTLRTVSFSSNSSSSGNRTITSNSTTLSHTQELNEVACFSSDGSYLAIQRNNRTEIFDVQLQRIVQCINCTNATAYEFSHLNDYLAIVSDKQLYIYDVALGNLIQTITETNIIRFCKFSSDMKSIFLGIHNDGLVNWRLEKRNEVEIISLLKKLVALGYNRNSIYFYQLHKDTITRSLAIELLVNQKNITEHFKQSVVEGSPEVSGKLKNALIDLLDAVKTSVRDNNPAFAASFILSILHQAYIDGLTSQIATASQFLLSQKIIMDFTCIDREKAEIDIKNHGPSQYIISFKITSKIRALMNSMGKLGADALTNYVGRVTLSFKCLLKTTDIKMLSFPILNFSLETPAEVKALILYSMTQSEDFKNMILLTNNPYAKLDEEKFETKMKNINTIAGKINLHSLTPEDLKFDQIHE